MQANRYFPPEWHEQAATVLIWPHYSGDYAQNIEAVEYELSALAQAIATEQQIIIICRCKSHETRISRYLKNSAIDPKRITYLMLPCDDVWARDIIPLTVFDNDHPIMLNFEFNGWGNKYPHKLDKQLPDALLKITLFNHLTLENNDLTLEGGAVETDGVGTLLATRQSILNKNRNPDRTIEEVESTLKQALGIERIIWLKNGHLQGDDTDSHIDTLARFCSETTIAYSSCTDPDDPHYQPLISMRKELGQLRTLDGSPYTLVPLPIPAPLFNKAGQRLPASYANFLFINNSLLVPVYDDPADNYALKQLEAWLPDRKIIPINCREVLQQYGSLHCLTMQLPKESGLSFPEAKI